MAFDRLKYRISADASDFKRELRKAGDEFSRFTRKNRYAIRDMKAAFAGAATAVAALGAALAGNALRATAQFEQSISSAGAKTGATVEEMYALRDAAREAGASTMFSAREAADGLGFLAQAGFDVQEQIKALPGLLNLAAAGELELAEAADIASNVLSGFGLEVDDLARVNDVLAKTASSSNTNVQQMGEALSYAAPVAAALGIEIEEAAAAVGTLSNAGIQASRAGTSLNGIMAKMRGVAGDLGVELTAAEVKSLGLAGSLAKLEAAGLTGANAMDYFGQRAGPGVAALLAAGTDSIADFRVELEKAEGAAQDMSDRLMDNLAGDFKALTSALGELNLVFGEVFGPASREGVQQLTALSREAGDSAEAFRNLRDDTLDLLKTARTAIKVLAVFAGTLRLVGAALQTVVGLFEGFLVGLAGAHERIRAINLSLKASYADSAEEAARYMKQAQAAFNSSQKYADKATKGLTGIGDAWGDALKDVESYGEMMRDVNRGIADFEDRARSASEHADFLADYNGQTMSMLPTGEQAVGYTPADSMSGMQSTLPEGVSVFGAPQPDTSATSGAASATRKLKDEVEEFAGQMRDAAATPMQKYLEQLDLLRQANERNLIVGDEYGRVLDQIRDKFDPVTKAANELREEAEKLKESLKSPGDEYVEEVQKLNEMLSESLITVDEYDRALKQLNIEYKGSAYAAQQLEERADALKESLRSAADVARERRDDIRAMFDAGLLSNGQYLQALGREGAPGLARLDEGDQGDLDQKLTNLKERARESERVAQRWSEAWQNALSEAFTTAAESGIEAFFSYLKGETQSAKEALQDMLGTLLKIGARAALLGAFQGSGSGPGIASALGFASGGYVSGPGTATSDSIPARLSNGEYVIQASAVRQVGTRFLDGVNQGRFDAAPQGFASGGLVQGGGGGINLRVVNVTSPEEALEAMATPAGEKVIWNIVEKKREEFARLINS